MPYVRVTRDPQPGDHTYSWPAPFRRRRVWLSAVVGWVHLLVISTKMIDDVMLVVV